MLHSQVGNHAAYPSEQLHILVSALDALQRGWSVIPLVGGEGARNGKKPALRWQRYQQTMPSDTTVRDWFTSSTYSAYGVICGNGLIVIDFDDADQQIRFIREFPELLETRIVQSGGRGLYHLYFLVDFSVPSQKFSSVDLQSGGRYVVGAGSRVAGGAWRLTNDAPVRSLTRTELNRIIDFLSPKDKSTSSDTALSQVSPMNISSDHFVHLYQTKVRERGGRNNALFHTGCQMRDAGFSRLETLATLVDVYAEQPPINDHPGETSEQRRREAERTIASVFSRPARQPISSPSAKCDDASYLSNALRETILQDKQNGPALLRTLEGLILAGIAPGTPVSEREICELLAGEVGRHSIRKALSYSPSPGPPSHAGADSATQQGRVQPCVFVPLPKPDKSPAHRPPQQYAMPSIDYLCALFDVEKSGSDPVTREDISSVKKYRSALTRELVRRRPGKYTQAWLAERLSVSRGSIGRYIKAEPIKSRWILEELPLNWRNFNQIPTGASAEAAGIAIRHCFLQDGAGKRYPPIIGLARKLLADGQQLSLMTRVCKSYWVEEDTSDTHTTRNIAPISSKSTAERHFFPKPDYPVRDLIVPDPINDKIPKIYIARDTKQESVPADLLPEAADDSEPPIRSSRYYRRPLPDSKDEYTAKTLYETCAGQLRREEARKLVDVYGRKVVGRAHWWMEQLMADGKIENPPGFFKVHVRGVCQHVHGTSPPDYTQPPKRKPRKKPYDLRTDPIWQSASYRHWRENFADATREPWECPNLDEDFNF